MFENLFTTLKNRANNLNDNLASKSKKFTSNLGSLKNRLYKKSNKPKSYYTVKTRDDNDYYNDEYLSPRAYTIDNFNSSEPTYESVNMEWVPYFPSKFDEHNIVDRFLKVITLPEDEAVRVGLILFG